MKFVDQFKKWFSRCIHGPSSENINMWVPGIESLSPEDVGKYEPFVVEKKECKCSKPRKKGSKELLDIGRNIRFLKHGIAKRDRIEKYRLLVNPGSIVKKSKAKKRLGSVGKNIRAFLKACCEFEKDNVIELRVLYKRYLEWCSQKNVKPTCIRSFPGAFDQKKIVTFRIHIGDKEYRCYRGIKLKD